MSKGKILGTILDMSDAARRQRAEDSGFDTWQTWFHGTSAEAAKALRGGAEFEGKKVFVTPRHEMADEYAHASSSPEVLELIGKPSDAEIDFDLPGQRTLTLDQARDYSGNYDWDLQDFIDAGHSVAFPRESIRLKGAAFDPSKSGSGSLMAGVAGAVPLAGIGAVGALGAPGEAQAAISQRAAAIPQGRNMQIRAPENDYMAALADYAQWYNEKRKEHMLPALDMALPFGEMPEDYLRRLSGGQEVGWGDRIGAILGLL